MNTPSFALRKNVCALLVLMLFLPVSWVSASTCFEEKLECLTGSMCTSNKMCPPVGGSCNDAGDGCLDSMSNEATDCIEPEKNKVDTCGDGQFCGEVSETCLPINCINYQKETCPESLDDGTCNEDGSTCPENVQCSIGQSTSGSTFSSFETIFCSSESTSTSSSSSSSTSTTTTTTTTTTSSTTSTSGSSRIAARHPVLFSFSLASLLPLLVMALI